MPGMDLSVSYEIPPATHFIEKRTRQGTQLAGECILNSDAQFGRKQRLRNYVIQCFVFYLG